MVGALADMYNMEKFIAICLLLARHVLLLQSNALPQAVVDDFFTKDGKLMQSNFAKSLDKAWYSTTQDYKLDVLRNDKILGASLDSCIEQEGQGNADKTVIEFQDIAQVIILSFVSYFFCS